uniref:Uncharacterized protein n=1 Tax=Arundo donax TaxID=35708 RepID=A0A0A9ADE7_ARUDO
MVGTVKRKRDRK